jgi:hypothetical protein
MHLIPGIVAKGFLNPGMISAWLIHVPWAVWTIWLLVQAAVMTNPYGNHYLLDGLWGVAFMVLAAFLLLIRYKHIQPHRGES